MSAAQVKEDRKKLGSQPEPEDLAALLDQLGTFVPVQGDEAPFNAAIKLIQDELRAAVSRKVRVIQRKALTATTGRQALMDHGRAARVLALFLITQDDAVLDEAQSLAVSQSELARRIELARRQRYNRWAVEQVEAAISAYHAADLSVETMGRSDDQQIVELMLKHLGELDPAMLEPVALDLYNYVLDLARTDVSEWWQIELAKKLTGTDVVRKTVEDF